MIFRIVGIDASKVIVIVGIVGVDCDAIRTAVEQRRTDHSTFVLLCLAVEREHDLIAADERIADAVFLLEHDGSVGQWLIVELCLGSPCAMEVRAPYIASAHRQERVVELCESDSLLLAIGDVAPVFNHIHIVVALIVETHGGRIERVGESDGEQFARTVSAVWCLVLDR